VALRASRTVADLVRHKVRALRSDLLFRGKALLLR